VAVAVFLGWVLYDALLARPRATAAQPTPAAEATPGGLGMSWPEPPAMAIDPARRYTATIETGKGEVTLELFAANAPKTVNSFVFLARQGYYDGVTFHRVLPGFMAQSGDPTGTGSGGPGYRFEDEIDPAREFDRAGLLAMANAGPNTNGSQFFITYAPTPWLNGNHTIFGQVVAGMEVVESLTPRDPSKDPDAPPGDRIETIRITEE
jgi:cyclophilin family peptidyl-prolyl cis-trans isomerase